MYVSIYVYGHTFLPSISHCITLFESVLIALFTEDCLQTYRGMKPRLENGRNIHLNDINYKDFPPKEHFLGMRFSNSTFFPTCMNETMENIIYLSEIKCCYVLLYKQHRVILGWSIAKSFIIFLSQLPSTHKVFQYGKTNCLYFEGVNQKTTMGTGVIYT